MVIIAAMAKGSTTMKKPDRIKSFTTQVPLDKAMKTIIQFAQSSGYRIDDFNETDGIIVISDTNTIRQGYIYPIYLIKQPDNFLSIEIGIKSKQPQFAGFDHPHERFLNGVRTAIYAVS